MTIETLEQYRYYAKEIDSIALELEHVYNTVKSPNGRKGEAVRGSVPSNPTEHAALAAIELQKELETKRAALTELTAELDAWLVTIGDPEIVSIIRYHYILGFNWKQTNLKVYGYPNYHRARNKFHKYFEKI